MVLVAWCTYTVDVHYWELTHSLLFISLPNPACRAVAQAGAAGSAVWLADKLGMLRRCS